MLQESQPSRKEGKQGKGSTCKAAAVKCRVEPAAAAEAASLREIKQVASNSTHRDSTTAKASRFKANTWKLSNYNYLYLHVCMEKAKHPENS